MTARSHAARQIRATIRAALHAGQALITAARGARFRTLVALYRAIDTGAAVRIAYTDSKGVESVRTITPAEFRISHAGDISIRAYDHRDQDVANFRTDRMTIAA